MKKVIVIGGGTGTFVALTGLKKYPLSLSAVITMMDSGGSTGRLRDQLGVLPPGDLRQALVALSSSEKIWRDLFVYRFENGDLSGHNFGNIFISALEKITGSIEKALELATKILQVKGEVIPVTFQKTELCVKLENGQVIEGETHIDEPGKIARRAPIARVYLYPQVSANPRALQKIKEATAIIIGPGDLYTSIIPNLLVKGVKKALAKSSSKKIFVMNLMTKYGQTTDFTAGDHFSELKKHLGCDIDYVLINTKRPSDQTFKWYKSSKESIVFDDLPKKNKKIIRAILMDDLIIPKNQSDRLRRSIIRHNPDLLAKKIFPLL